MRGTGFERSKQNSLHPGKLLLVIFLCRGRELVPGNEVMRSGGG